MRRTIAWLFTILLAATTGAVLSGTVAVLTAPFPEQASAGASEAMAWSFYDAVNTVLRTGETGPLDALLAPEMIEHNPAPGLPSTRDGLTRHLLGLHATAPGTQIVPEHVFASDDTVTARVRVEGSAPRLFLGVPVGVDGPSWGTLDQFRVAAHRIVEHWSSVVPDTVLEPLRQAHLGHWFAPEQIVALERFTWAPGARIGALAADESHLIYLESGMLTVSLDPYRASAALFAQADGAGAAVSDVKQLQPQEIAPGVTLTLLPGDLLALPIQSLWEIRNDGDVPAAALVVAAFSPGNPFRVTAHPHPAQPSAARSDRDDGKFDVVPLAGAMQTALPLAGTAVEIGRATLAPGRDLVLSGAAGPLFLVAESGPLALDVEAGTTWVHRASNGFSIVEAEGVLGVGDGAFIDPETAITFRNLGGTPATILVVTILPEESPP